MNKSFYIFLVSLFFINAFANEELTLEQIKEDIFKTKEESDISHSEELYIKMLRREYTLTHMARLKEFDMYRQLLDQDYEALESQFLAMKQAIESISSGSIDPLEYQHYVGRYEAASKLLSDHAERMGKLNEVLREGTFCGEEALLQITPKVSFESSFIKKEGLEEYQTNNPLNHYNNRLNAINEQLIKVENMWSSLSQNQVYIASLVSPTKKMNIKEYKNLELEIAKLNKMGIDTSPENPEQEGKLFYFDNDDKQKTIYLSHRKMKAYRDDVKHAKGYLDGLKEKYLSEKRKGAAYSVNEKSCQYIQEHLGQGIYEKASESFRKGFRSAGENTRDSQRARQEFIKVLKKFDEKLDEYIGYYSEPNAVDSIKRQIRNHSRDLKLARNILKEFFDSYVKENKKSSKSEKTSVDLRYLTAMSILVKRSIPKNSREARDIILQDFMVLDELLFFKPDSVNATVLLELKDLIISRELAKINDVEKTTSWGSVKMNYQFSVPNFFHELYVKFKSSDPMPKGKMNIVVTVNDGAIIDFNKSSSEGSLLESYNDKLDFEYQIFSPNALTSNEFILHKMIPKGIHSQTKVKEKDPEINSYFKCMQSQDESLREEIFIALIDYKTWTNLKSSDFFSEKKRGKCNGDIRLNLVEQFLISRLAPLLSYEEKETMYKNLLSNKDSNINKFFKLR